MTSRVHSHLILRYMPRLLFGVQYTLSLSRLILPVPSPPQVVTEAPPPATPTSATLTSLLTRLVPEGGLDSQDYLCAACRRPIGVSESRPVSGGMVEFW